MYARRVSMALKPDSRADLTNKLESQIIPVLRKQTGFKDLITFISPDGEQAFGISLWDTRDNAEKYDRTAYASVAKVLSTVVKDTPKVRAFEVTNSTFHHIADKQKAA